MNKEKYNQIIESAWKEYADSHFIPGNPKGKLLSDQLFSVIPMVHNRESFREEIRKNPEFAKKWGLKIEERELSLEERAEWLQNNKGYDLLVGNLDHDHIREVVEEESPTKLITITYNNETVEIYE